ncbi:hypothetical protein [uncultured Azohydromonas sp.]|uniref:hypothetical protein n=1 Tax=uncultured Azohydromonas sp. TaxID=487342 RepID=UPI00260B531F|nr:hypothetical protein [uncultured Azohydromonas sp.]
MSPTPPRARLVLTGCALLLAALAAQAQSGPPRPPATSAASPYYLGASVARGRDSNVFRVPSAQGPQSDSYTTGSVLAGADRPIGRQRVYTDLALRRQRFSRLNELDNNGYGASAGVDWETAGRFSGQVKGTTEKSLASYGSPFTATTLRARNILRERTFNASVQRGTARSKLQPFVGFNKRKTKYSAEAYRFRDNDRRAVRAGVRWRPSDRLTLATAAVHARGKYPFSRTSSGVAPLPDEYRSRGIEISADWEATGKSRLDGRIGYEQRRYELATRRDFSGINGLLRWRWQPTGKLTFTTSLVRDADDTERLLPADTTDLTATGSRVTNSAILDGTWQATAKVAVNANLRYSDRKLVNPVVDASGGAQNLSGSDTTRFTTLGATWEATRNVSAGCNVGRVSRTTNSSLSFPYKANTVNCQVQALLR